MNITQQSTHLKKHDIQQKQKVAIQPTTYCDYVANLPADNVHRIYHDTQYGFAINDDNELFGRLILEINQAGLSWNTILTKQDNFRKAYDNFNIAIIARYDEVDKQRLLSDTGVIRNKLKVAATIYNAQQVVKLQAQYGSFKAWLDVNHPKTHADWVKLFKKTFKFTGNEITKEFLMSTGYLAGAHVADCYIQKQLRL